MQDMLSQTKRSLAGWLWSETKDMEFDSVFCPFTGWPVIPAMFKEQGKGVITTDLLAAHYHVARALVENDEIVLDPFDVDKLLEPSSEKVQLMEGVCNAYGMDPEHGAWLDNLHANMDRLEDNYKISLAIAVALRVIRYVLSFNDSTRSVMPEEDLAGCFHYYVESLNTKIFSGGQACEAYHRDAAGAAASADTNAMYFYVPSSTGFAQLSPQRRMMELFARYCNEPELDAQLTVDAGAPGAPMDSEQDYRAALESFLQSATHIPLWIIASNQNCLISREEFGKLLMDMKSELNMLSKKVILEGGDSITEYLFIAHD